MGNVEPETGRLRSRIGLLNEPLPDPPIMTGTDDGSRWGILAIAGACGVCCISLGALFGGATLAGGAAAGVTATSGVVRSFGGAAVTAIATAAPLLVIGLVLRYRLRAP